MDANNKEERPLNPRSKANIFEIITFSWILKLVQKGLKKELDVIDLYTILDEDSSALLGSKLKKIWSKEQRTATKKNKKPSFLNALFKMFGSKLIIHGIYLAITDMVFSIIQTIFVGKIISHFESKNTKNQFHIVVYYAVGLIIICSLKTFSSNSYNMMSSHLAMKMRVATCDLIYNKALRLKTNSLETTTGRIVNLMSNDVIRFDLTIVYIGYIFIGPLETIMVTYFLWKEVGVPSILGVATFIIFIPLQVWLGSIVSNYRLKTANRTDARVNLMNEIISGIQVIKMYTWEHFFTKLIEFARK
uniref:Multidrug resistance-associated protein 4 n=2 Tax=Schizaphis graminum TaxID=13262 RepID=A0A2S2PMH1_SCHGA